ncbi:MAG: hypothetical protein IPK69_11850 [Phycisphaerales bacterium]|nr:MAG: hypothetical protein IPK69_11850 [Phycisphaerales bacterium]
MADVIWPAGLPQAPQVAGYSQQDEERTVRTAMAVGPAKVRRRATAAVENCDVEIKLTRTQVALLKTFYRESIQAGALAFTWKHHQTGNEIDYRFLGAPVLVPRAPRQGGTEYWVATFRLETMPGTEVTSEPPDPPDPPPPEDPPVIVITPDVEAQERERKAERRRIPPVLVFDEPQAITPVAEDSPVILTPHNTKRLRQNLLEEQYIQQSIWFDDGEKK